MANETALNPQPIPPGAPVRIFVSHDITYDLAKMNRITASVLAKLGCGGCHSGRVLHFQTIQDFVVNPRSLEVMEAPSASGM
jgi:hypothetical protein